MQLLFSLKELAIYQYRKKQGVQESKGNTMIIKQNQQGNRAGKSKAGIRQRGTQLHAALFYQYNTTIHFHERCHKLAQNVRENGELSLASKQSLNILKSSEQVVTNPYQASTKGKIINSLSCKHISHTTIANNKIELEQTNFSSDFPQVKRIRIVEKIFPAGIIFNICRTMVSSVFKSSIKKIKRYSRRSRLSYFSFKIGTSQQIIIGLEINNHICTIVDHNDALLSSYAHFHVLLYLSNSQILSCYDGRNELLSTVNSLIIQHLQQPRIRRQLSELDYYTVMSFLVGIRKKSRTQILDFMRNFIRQNSQLLQGVCPYYYNLFSLVVNKPIVFESMQPNREQLLSYTVQYAHPTCYSGKFRREDVQREVREIQKLMIEKYHSGEE